MNNNEPLQNEIDHTAPDETDYLLSTDANRKHLEESIREAEEGKLTTIAIADLWN